MRDLNLHVNHYNEDMFKQPLDRLNKYNIVFSLDCDGCIFNGASYNKIIMNKFVGIIDALRNYLTDDGILVISKISEVMVGYIKWYYNIKECYHPDFKNTPYFIFGKSKDKDQTMQIIQCTKPDNGIFNDRLFHFTFDSKYDIAYSKLMLEKSLNLETCNLYTHDDIQKIFNELEVIELSIGELVYMTIYKDSYKSDCDSAVNFELFKESLSKSPKIRYFINQLKGKTRISTDKTSVQSLLDNLNTIDGFDNLTIPTPSSPPILAGSVNARKMQKKVVKKSTKLSKKPKEKPKEKPAKLSKKPKEKPTKLSKKPKEKSTKLSKKPKEKSTKLSK